MATFMAGKVRKIGKVQFSLFLCTKRLHKRLARIVNLAWLAWLAWVGWLAWHSGKCYVMRVGKNLKESSDAKNFNVIRFVYFLRSNVQIFVRICLPVLLLPPEIAKRHILLTLAQVPK